MKPSEQRGTLSARPGRFSSPRAALLIIASIGAFAFAACEDEPKPSSETPEPNVPVPDDCAVDADCGFGEIDHEINRPADCPCIYGCPYLPLSTNTIARRQSQYDATCDTRMNGEGHGCGIDDCNAPPEPACIAGKCTAAPDDVENQ